MKTVLIVEDEKLIRQGLRKMIQRSGVPVEVIMECNNGETALEILKEQSIDVMFTDIRMPKMDGIELVERIEEHYASDLNMAVVSNYLSMNYSLFSYSFKQYTGSNFVNYLRDIRMKEAKRLLAGTDMRIAEISQAVGYENEKHFMKLFKGCCGVSPSEYRRNMGFIGDES